MALADSSVAFEHIEAPVITFDTYEGNAVVALAEVGHGGATDTVTTWAAPILENYFLEMHADLRVKAAAAGTQTLIGIAHKKAEALAGRPTTPYSVGTHTGGGTGIVRQVAVECFFQWTREVPIATGGTTAAISQSIQPDSGVAHEWEGAGSLNNLTIVLKAAAAGANAIAAFGYHGGF
jgi:hypothetical protein